MTELDFNWMAGGPQGSGVDAAANIFGRACAYGGLYVYGRREYHSNIKGLHSYFHLRVSTHEVLANVNDVDLLAAFDAETIVRHLGEVVPGGGIIVDKDQLNTNISAIPTLPLELKSTLRRYLESRGLSDRLGDLLEDAKKREINIFQVPYMDLLKQIATKLGIDKLSKIMRTINVLTLGISFGLIDYEIELVEKAIKAFFREKPKIIEMNILAMSLAYEYAKENFSEDFKFKIKSLPVREERILLSGNQAVAIGKVLGGCRFQTYYPITPAADESEYIESHEILKSKIPGENAGVVVLQTEDEISAINMASGAALTGVRASTSTSGPGFSLMVEGLSWAGNNEVPVVITYYQRGAPSTGLPTRHGQDDLRFAIHAGHGEFPRIVLASGDIRECFYDAIAAFNYAERFQLPVIHLIDKALANSFQTFPMFEIKDIKIQRGNILNEEDLRGIEYKRFAFTEGGISPRVFLGTKGGIHWYTGDEHNEFGHISEEADNRTKMMEKRMSKLETIDREISINEKINFFGNEDADNIVVSWGSPKGAIIEALNKLTSEGFNLSFLQVRMVHPIPIQHIKEILQKAERIIDVEMNYSGQLGGIIREKTGISMDFQILKYNGRPMTSTEVYNAIKLVLQGRAPKRQVLNYGS
ncbi:MAG: 2-oxoacid:acceptor oxidoreductase subunit alpha [Candidatus Methanomethyliaceae archaeon]|nr:2-oxoacid:acceptor oxidoreductase subunit alpha [Candidatus Methanomethyliaceae archaeon]MDW7970315.1 2-oxoacid:ferredoxin oxidoreductase subunit alpha [Nitrososphaerota archaeon]